MYTGYAIFPPKTVSWVLSVERMSGITVAPGCHDSSDLWLHSSVQKVKQKKLDCAPVQTTTNHLYTSRHTLAAFVHGPHNVAQVQKLSPVQTQDLRRSRGYNARHHENEIEGFHFQ